MKQYPDTARTDPVLGILDDDPIALVLGTGYMRFSSPSGIDGLAKRDGTRLDILAVIATKPGTGQFRKFISRCKVRFETVCVWHDFNPQIGEALARYGFHPETDIAADGETLTGWRWDALADHGSERKPPNLALGT